MTLPVVIRPSAQGLAGRVHQLLLLARRYWLIAAGLLCDEQAR